MIVNILLTLVIMYIMIQTVKSFTIGPAFSIVKWIRYKDDYKKWYKYRQTYIPSSKREHFSKGKKNEN